MGGFVWEAGNSGQEGKISYHWNVSFYGTTSIVLPQLYFALATKLHYVSKVLFNNSVVIN